MIIQNHVKNKSKNKLIHDYSQKHIYGDSLRTQLKHNNSKYKAQVNADKAAPEVINKLNQESINERNFKLSKKPVITKYTK